MPMRIYADETTPIPHRMFLGLACDGRLGMLPCTESGVWPCDTGHPRDPGVRAGWKFDKDGPVYCPRCR